MLCYCRRHVFTASIKLHDFSGGIGKDEQSALSWLRSKGILESAREVRCKKEKDEQICRSEMYEGYRTSSNENSRMSVWRCRSRGCNCKRSVLEGNEFFMYRDILGRIQTKLGAHIILELVWHWLYMTSILRQLSYCIGVDVRTVWEWFHHRLTTVGMDMENVPKFVGTDLNPIQIDEAKVAGTAKYNNGRRMVGDIVDDDDDGDDLEDWNTGNNNEGDDDESDTESDFVQFGIDDSSWTWVVGIYGGRD